MSAVPSKAEGRISETAIDGEVVVMNLDLGTFFALSGTALAIWQRIDGKASRDAIVDRLQADFAADRADLAADVDAFLEHLREAGLVRLG